MDKNNSTPPELASGGYKRSNRELGKTRVGDENDQPERKKQRHTREQIQQMEAFFKTNPRPNEEQRNQLSTKLQLETSQIRVWFQNHRAQVKAQQEVQQLRLENTKLKNEARQEVQQLRLENTKLKNEARQEVQQLRLENAKLKNESAAHRAKSSAAGRANAAKNELLRLDGQYQL